MANIKVLAVDDEPYILNMVQRIMQLTIDCEVQTAASGDQALALMEKNHFDVVIADIKMPGMDGITLINIIAELYPNTMRLILSARTTGEIGLKTAGAVHQFFLKPTDVSVIANRIKNVIGLRNYFPSEGLDKIVSHIRSLPSIPAVCNALEHELKKTDMSMESVGRILEQDIAMSAKVLHLVNSAFFGMRERVTKPSQAVVLLGGQVIKSLLMGSHIFTEWTRQAIPGFSIQELWNHSLHVALCARELAMAEGCGEDAAAEFYIGGLFHDIGKIVIADNLPEACGLIQRRIHERRISVIEAEKEVLGATHAEAGAFLMALWGFSSHVVNACAFHHRPADFAQAGFSPVTAVHVANVFDYEHTPHGSHITETLDAAYIDREKFGPKLDAWRAIMTHAGKAPWKGF